MTVSPLTERLEAAINAVYTADEGTSSYRLDDDTRALLLETAEAVEFATEKIASLAQSAADLDIARQAAEARVETLTAALDYYAGVRGHPVSGVLGHDDGQLARDALAGKDGGER